MDFLGFKLFFLIIGNKRGEAHFLYPKISRAWQKKLQQDIFGLKKSELNESYS